MRSLIAPFRWFTNTRVARSLRFRLVMLVLLASLPTLGLLFLTASQQRADALQSGQAEATRLARIAASDHGREMDRIQRELALLVRLPEVRGNNSSACTAFFQGLVSDPDNPIYVDLRAVNPDGSIFCRSSAADPIVAEEDPEFIEDAFDGVQFTVGRYRINPLTGRSIISFASPVRGATGDIVRVVIATLDLGSQSTFLSQTELPEGAIVRIINEDGTLLLQRPPRQDETVGSSLLGTPVVDAAVGAEPPPDESDENPLTTDGYVSAVRPISITSTPSVSGQASVIVLLPEEEIVRRANNAFRDNLGKLGVAAVIVVFAAWISADLFVARDGETRKSIVAELYHAYSSGVVEHLDSIIDPGFVDHSPAPGQAKGVEGIKQGVAAFRTAFPDGEIVAREMLADRDKVVARVSLTGTHLGDYQGVPATGKRMIADGTETFRFQGGVIVESWSLFGPLVEVTKITTLEQAEEEPVPKRSWFQRIFRRGKNIETPEAA